MWGSVLGAEYVGEQGFARFGDVVFSRHILWLPPDFSLRCNALGIGHRQRREQKPELNCQYNVTRRGALELRRNIVFNTFLDQSVVAHAKLPTFVS
jgi:hypothetical protein